MGKGMGKRGKGERGWVKGKGDGEKRKEKGERRKGKVGEKGIGEKETENGKSEVVGKMKRKVKK